MAKTLRTLRITRAPRSGRWPVRNATDRQRARRRRHKRQELAGRVLQVAATVVSPHDVAPDTAEASDPGRPTVPATRRLGAHRSWWSVSSLLSAGSLLSALSVGSVLSIGSVGSILSIGSAGSVLSIGSAGSILSIGSLGARNATGAVGTPARAGTAELDAAVRTLATAATVAALASGARPARSA